MTKKTIDLKGPLHRQAEVIAVREEEDTDSRTVEIAFSSEEPYERYFGVEVLDHDSQSVRLDRLNGGAAVLVNHDTDDQVGVVESARVDEDKKGRAVIRFGRSQRAEEIYQDVKDGIRRLISVGYRIDKYEVTEREGLADLVRVTDWTPYEVSLVAVPADTTVGVGRSDVSIEPKEQPMDPKDKQDTPAPAQATPVDRDAELQKLRTAERKRVDAIREIADRYSLDEQGRQAISEGSSPEEFTAVALTEVGKRNSAARVNSGHDGEVDLSPKERKQFSLVALMDAIAHPNERKAVERAGFELEVSQEAIRGFGPEFDCRGQFVPTSLLEGRRNLTAGTATDGAELVGTELLAMSFIDVLRNASSVMRAGATVMSGLVGNVDIPRQTSGAVSTWISTEGGDATEGEPQFDQVSLTPKDLACFTEVTRRLRQQSTPAVEGIVRNDLAFAQALGIDKAALYGSNASGQPRGLVNQVGINTLDLAAANPTYAELVKMVADVIGANVPMDGLAWLLEAQGWEALMTTPKQGSGVEGNFILGDSGTIVGHPHFVSQQVTAQEYFVGAWQHLMIGEWGGLEMNVDPFTKALAGSVRYITFKTCDVATRYPQAFAYAHDGITP